MRKRNPGLSATKRKLRSEKIELESYLVQLRCGRLHTNRIENVLYRARERNETNPKRKFALQYQNLLSNKGRHSLKKRFSI